jgi:hypothetical protein
VNPDLNLALEHANMKRDNDLEFRFGFIESSTVMQRPSLNDGVELRGTLTS